ncbi:hypothetical protein ACH5RR_033678 [Cinchona calisaya]|uniref:Aminotransferase-like plant mobile domain-containing protein n=1 Tax=Cinchona calisaya TaxID=153742 RepID=A0ABD2YDA1_9GENT
MMKLMRISRYEGDYWSYHTQYEGVLHYIRLVGFEGLYRIGSISYDHALIIALVERWRQETHIFHLPVGEAAVMLKDVEVLFALQVDGDVVIPGPEKYTELAWANIHHSLLGFTPHEGDIKGSRIKASTCEHVLRFIVSDDASDEEL